MVRGGGVGRRCQTSQAGGGGGTSPVGKGLVVVAGGSTFLAGLVGYASWSDKNRKVGVLVINQVQPWENGSIVIPQYPVGLRDIDSCSPAVHYFCFYHWYRTIFGFCLSYPT